MSWMFNSRGYERRAIKETSFQSLVSLKYAILRGRPSLPEYWRCLESRLEPPVPSERGTHYLHSVLQARFREREARKTRDPIVAIAVDAVVPKFPRAR